mmetsp:Transcript_18681/g.52232  ORF Transcript_18681/g.52232 Transcript_18681/m.52232 type:complete len:1188 (+) Transcript_18681:289-3852(+)|eukprot:CAMPEP_0172366876 /NCGR_PEP_ID=MMETSP1060-20121228/17609_1 /TAXON_ID=37318 /ORGANISM="Pseudo-nitzschia pungens, Strain cf. cingulata" /LENGTH=1187 /DNA_ID=CAMNT_0013090905 /DNA_START=246 /DNA_END=3809 /DNA_ORIENTATION=-
MRLNKALSLLALTLAAPGSSTALANKELSPEELERSILLEFYEATNGHSWNEDYGWAHNLPDICSWTGVECRLSPADIAAAGGSLVSGRNPVVGLYLPDNFLSGRTPASLWKLPSLKWLDLGFNPSLDVDFGSLADSSAEKVPPIEGISVRGTATTSVKGVHALSETLTELTLSDNKFESQFPPDLLELRKLTSLSCANCHLRGGLPDGEETGIDHLSQLRNLDLYNNDLTGTLPEGLATLVHLRSIVLAKNQFHGKLPQFVSDELVLLEEFWINFNDFTGTIPPFDKQPTIQKLYLNGNSFTGTLPDTFLDAAVAGPEGYAASGNPLMINLGKNELTGVIPGSLDRLSILPVTWRFGGNAFTGIDISLCDNGLWNDGGVERFACRGLVCPPGTYSEEGFHTVDNPCEPCSTADYFGTFECFDYDDRAVLLELYKQLGGDDWIHNDGWKTAPRHVADDDWSEEWNDYCDWYGIECWDLGDAKDGRLRKIHLGSNNLKGTMPEIIFSLEHMTFLDVSNNPELVVGFRNIGRAEHLYSVNVGGTQTKDFDGIQHANDFFKRLYADNTPISGTIPTEIVRIHNLEVLSLQQCDLNGELPVDLFAMSSLEELYLGRNNFQGFVPDRWEALKKLEVLSLAQNAFRGNIPESLGYAPSLRALTLKDQVSKGGGFTGSLPSFRKSRSLTRLIVSDNRLEGPLPEDLLLASDAGEEYFLVDLTNNKITGKVHGTYERFNQMDLFLEGNLISEIDERLCNNPLWMSGDVGAYGCEAILCPAGTYNQGGRRMYMDDSCAPCDKKEMSSSTDESILGQSTCGAAEAAVVLAPIGDGDSPDASSSETSGSATTAAAVQSMERGVLEALYDQTGGADGGWATATGWKTDANFCNWYGIDCDENGSVASIQLGANGLKGTVPSLVWSLPNLVHLKIYGNDVNVEFTDIEFARKLQTLGLDGTGMRSVAGLGKARSLTSLNLAKNNLAGNLPQELSRLVNLEILDLSSNKFTGELPFWLKNFAKLTSFSVANNKIGGWLPDFASITKLSYLDLSHNQFKGTLPPTLLAGSPPDDKVVVDLSHNKIDGVVPGAISRLTRLSIQLEENQIIGIDAQLCAMDGVNDFDVMSYGCSGILCPIGTWNNLGRQSNDVPCEPCKKAKYMGSTTCGSDTTTVGSGAIAAPTGKSVLAALVSGVVLLWGML